MDAKSFGARISNRRHELSLTQAALAQKVGVTDKAVSKWERGAGLPDVELLEPLAVALGMSVDELIRGEGATPQGAQAVEPTVQIAIPEPQSITPVSACGAAHEIAPKSANTPDEPKARRRGIRGAWAERVLPVAAALVLLVAIVFAAQQFGDGRVVAPAATDGGGSTSPEQPSYTSSTGTVSRAAIEKSQAAAEKDRAELQLARDQQEWRMANREWSSDDLQWDAVTVGGVTTIGAELKVREACQALGNGAFEPDFVSGVQALRLENEGELLRIEATGSYANGTAGTCIALVGGVGNSPVVQELVVARG